MQHLALQTCGKRPVTSTEISPSGVAKQVCHRQQAIEVLQEALSCAFTSSATGADGCWDALPPQILRQVLAKVGEEHAAQARMVSKWWLENHDAVLGTLRPPRLALASIINKFPALEALDTGLAAGCAWPVPTSHDNLVGIREGLTELTKLRSLRNLGLTGAGSVHFLGSCMGVDGSVLSAIASGLTGLTRLSIASCPLIRPNGLLVLAPLAGLRELDMQGCEQMRDASLASVAEALPSLETLLVSGCTKLTDLGIENLSSLQNLSTLHTGSCPFVYGYKHTGLRSLTDLDMSENSTVCNADLYAMAASRLKRLRVSRCSSLHGQFKTLHYAGAQKGFVSLEDLDISGCPKIHFIASYLNPMACLTSLDISNCQRMFNEAINYFIPRSTPVLKKLVACDNLWLDDRSLIGMESIGIGMSAGIVACPLEHLDLRGCRSITARGVAGITGGRTARSLKALYFDCPVLGPEGLGQLLRAMSNLETLHAGAHFSAVDSLADTCLVWPQRLRKLSMPSVDVLDDDGLDAIVDSLPQLVELNLGPTPRLTYISQLAELTALTCLELQGLRRISADEWRRLGPFPWLRSLSLECCRFRSAAGLQGLAGRAPRLRYLSLRHSDGIGNSALEKLRDCAILMELDLGGTQVSDVAMPILAEMMVQSIHLDECHSLSPKFCRNSDVPTSSSRLQQILHWMPSE